MKKWYIGCSGFSYRHWKGRFYPEDVPQKKWFEFYCQSFDTVELNVTFYRVPSLDTFKSWHSRSPEDFKFTVKAPRLITHYKKFRNITTEVEQFYGIVEKGLRDKLGTVLFQLHPRFEYSEENLDLVLKHLDPAFSNVIEFRHQTWWRDDVYRALKENHTTFCSISYPSLSDEVIKTAPVMYYRFHGVPQLYRSPYSKEKLKQVVDDVKSFRRVEEVYMYFNNDIDVAAIHDARQVQEMVNTVQRSTSVRKANKKLLS